MWVTSSSFIKIFTSATESISPDETRGVSSCASTPQGQVLRLVKTIAVARVLSSNRISWFGCE
jgi:hypothetical protein